ncbi:MAG: heparan-alpha-glucosaminide N-acetyltransferase [Candidatus Altiarchaeia archaeon]
MAYGNERFWEIDLLRGIAIVLMVAFHILYDLRFFGFAGINLSESFWYYAPRFIATLFILLVGVSLSISYSRTKRCGQGAAPFRRFLCRGAGIFFWGMAITAVTLNFFPGEYVVFGILHFIGLSIVLAYPFLRMRYGNLVLGGGCIAAGLFLEGKTFPFPYLLFAGFVPPGFESLDFFPLFPWFGVVLVGVFLGNALYYENARRFSLRDRSKNIISETLCYAGRHSLSIYLLHQPAIVAVLFLIGLVSPGSFF